MSTPIPDRAGLQPERTGLAWQRTCITATVSLLTLVAVGIRLQDWALTVVFSAAAIIGAALVLGVHARMADLRVDRLATAPYAAMVRVALTTALAAGCGIAAGIRVYLG